ncbi:putative toxin-antitoxin system toxin component, PIN family [Paucibacter sp. Y2R2-4]|uniref:PIN domain-containing protein n=1 Tax=Paucibacter sp. Y2R2-4 TaxID=2893553 RepID=UPI0021E49A7F|nr:PIN domain-containing protein [Paucibacter sp. Y2R2-4]MCV2351053.1 PIN domain-containing protein [Paucibacter sp. Y2R2-4]
MLEQSSTPVNPSYDGGIKTVIDTQVVMDWLVFKNPAVSPIVERVESGALRWLGLMNMREEMLHVLGRGIASSYGPDLEYIVRMFEQHCHLMASVPPPAVRLVCRDKDDQMFIDLALASGSRWLISRDRAVLALAKRAAKVGLEVLSPEKWIHLHSKSFPE